MSRVVILGAGIMGLAAAYRATQLGHEVTILEADRVAGGMAAHFDFGGVSVERFYHFVCRADAPTFALMEELGIADKMRFVPAATAYFTHGKLYKWSTPWALLTFPHLSLVAKIRYGLQMFLATKRSDWAKLDGMTARQWIESGSGREAYNKLWRSLMDLKFYEYAEDISAAWIWTRVKRIGTSRRSLFQEELGYIEGGSETLVTTLCHALEKAGARLHLGTPAQQVLSENGCVTGVVAGAEIYPADAVISTVPAPLVPKLVPELPDGAKAAYAGIPNIGVVCVMLRLEKKVSEYFWVNVVAPDIEIPGFIEFSNLRPLGSNLVYVPYYMPVTNEKWAWPDDAFVQDAFAALRRVNPELAQTDLLYSAVGRLKHAQPVCGPHFLQTLPPVQTAIAGLQAADTCFYYPEDRGIAESIRIGRQMAEAVA
jgi:protoporphyrinogen oxidase